MWIFPNSGCRNCGRPTPPPSPRPYWPNRPYRPYQPWKQGPPHFRPGRPYNRSGHGPWSKAEEPFDKI